MGDQHNQKNCIDNVHPICEYIYCILSQCITTGVLLLISTMIYVHCQTATHSLFLCNTIECSCLFVCSRWDRWVLRPARNKKVMPITKADRCCNSEVFSWKPVLGVFLTLLHGLKSLHAMQDTVRELCLLRSNWKQPLGPAGCGHFLLYGINAHINLGHTTPHTRPVQVWLIG